MARRYAVVTVYVVASRILAAGISALVQVGGAPPNATTSSVTHGVSSGPGIGLEGLRLREPEFGQLLGKQMGFLPHPVGDPQRPRPRDRVLEDDLTARLD